jgi:pimeloyl-ACP methyl ester carboxylesterase
VTDPPVLLVMGIGASMLWWEEGFCRMLAGRSRFVLRYDHRDTGRLVTYPPGSAAVVPGDRSFPPPTQAFMRFVTSAQADWSDAASVIEYLVSYSRMLAGGRRLFDEAAARELVRRDVERASDFAAAHNHDAIPDDQRPRQPLSSIQVPTLVIHGTTDPMFPPEHGQALAREIAGARLLPLQDAGHGIDRADWETLVGAIVEHTAQA